MALKFRVARQIWANDADAACVPGVAWRHRTDREILQSKVSQKRKGSWEGQVPVCRLLCKVSGDCQVVLRRLLDRGVRGRLITILRGKGEVLYRALCGLWSWVSRTESRRWQHAGWSKTQMNLIYAAAICKKTQNNKPPQTNPDTKTRRAEPWVTKCIRWGYCGGLCRNCHSHMDQF